MLRPKGPYCQSCGMPLSKDEMGGGTEADGRVSTEYCSHCYWEGAFTDPSLTAEQMAERGKAERTAYSRALGERDREGYSIAGAVGEAVGKKAACVGVTNELNRTYSSVKSALRWGTRGRQEFADCSCTLSRRKSHT